MSLLRGLFWFALFVFFTFCFIVLFEYGTHDFVPGFQKESTGRGVREAGRQIESQAGRSTEEISAQLAAFGSPIYSANVNLGLLVDVARSVGIVLEIRRIAFRPVSP